MNPTTILVVKERHGQDALGTHWLEASATGYSLIVPAGAFGAIASR